MEWKEPARSHFQTMQQTLRALMCFQLSLQYALARVWQLVTDTRGEHAKWQIDIGSPIYVI